MTATGPMLHPEGLLEVVLAVDTTNSSSPVLKEVQRGLQDMIQHLQADIPGIRIGIIARGNFFDKNSLTKMLDLSTDVQELCRFMGGVKGTGGEVGKECYELILRKVLENFSWTTESGKILVMIEDINSQEPDCQLNVDNVDWRSEIDCFCNKGIKIYGVQVFDHKGAEDFFRTTSTNTGGHYLRLSKLSNICDFIMAICYQNWSENLFCGYVAEVRAQCGSDAIPKDIEGLFRTLRRKAAIKTCRPVAISDPPECSSSPAHCPQSPVCCQSAPDYLLSSPPYITPVGSVPPSPVYSPLSPNYEPLSPVYSPLSPGYSVPPSPVYSQFSSDSGLPSPAYSLYLSPDYGAVSPVYNPSLPDHPALSQAYSASSPNYRAVSPAYSASTPDYRAISPAYSLPSPDYEPSSPVYSPSSPDSGVSSPAYNITWEGSVPTSPV